MLPIILIWFLVSRSKGLLNGSLILESVVEWLIQRLRSIIALSWNWHFWLCQVLVTERNSLLLNLCPGYRLLFEFQVCVFPLQFLVAFPQMFQLIGQLLEIRGQNRCFQKQIISFLCQLSYHTFVIGIVLIYLMHCLFIYLLLLFQFWPQ